MDSSRRFPVEILPLYIEHNSFAHRTIIKTYRFSKDERTKEFIKRNIAGEIVLVPSGQTAREFNGMVTLTETGEFIWEHIEEAESFNHLVLLILEEYEVDKDTASQDAAGFIMQLLQAGMIRPTGINW